MFVPMLIISQSGLRDTYLADPTSIQGRHVVRYCGLLHNWNAETETSSSCYLRLVRTGDIRGLDGEPIVEEEECIDERGFERIPSDTYTQVFK